MRTGQKEVPGHVTEVLRVNSRGPPALLPLLGTLESRLWPVGLQYIAAADAIRSYQVDLALLASQGYTKIAPGKSAATREKMAISPPSKSHLFNLVPSPMSKAYLVGLWTSRSVVVGVPKAVSDAAPSAHHSTAARQF